MNSSVESQKFFGFCGSLGLQGAAAARSRKASCICNGARSGLCYSSCPWVWSSRAVSLCPSCCLQNLHFLGKTPLLISMVTPAHRPRFSFQRTGQSRPRERVKGSILRNGYFRLVGQFTLGMQKLLMTHDTADIYSAVQVSRSKKGRFRSRKLNIHVSVGLADGCRFEGVYSRDVKG